MTVFDLVVVSIVGASVVAGALRGLLRALVTAGALIAGLLVATHWYPTVAAALRVPGLVASDQAADAAGFLLPIGLALILGLVAGRLLTRSLRRARLLWIDRVLGAIFGFLRGMAVCSVIYMALTAFPVHVASVTEARTAGALAAGAQILGAFTSSDLRRRFHDEYDRLVNGRS